MKGLKKVHDEGKRRFLRNDRGKESHEPCKDDTSDRSTSRPFFLLLLLSLLLSLSLPLLSLLL